VSSKADRSFGSAVDQAADFNLFDPAQEPHSLYGELRTSCPVARSEELGGYTLVTRAEDIYSVMTDPSTFSNQYDWPPGHQTLGPRVPANYDPPEHTAYRRTFAPLFSPAVVSSIEGATRAKAVELLERVAAKEGPCDFVADFCQPYPSLVFLPFLGLSADELEELLELHEQIFIMLHRGPSLDGGTEQMVRLAEEKLRVKVNEALDARTSADRPPNDIFSSLLAARLPDGRLLSREEILATISLLFGAGLGTIKNTLAMTMWFLGTNSEYRDLLVHEPSLIPGAVEEFLRYFALVVVPRLVTRDTELHDTSLPRGTIVLCPLSSSGRDPSAHSNPEVIDFKRNPNRHYGFGAGPHRCLGSHLARMELRVALEEIHLRMPNYSVDPTAKPEWTWGLVCGMASLPLTVGDTPSLRYAAS